MSEQKMENKKRLRTKWGVFALFALLFAYLYIFFRYVHPIGPWDGDDWNTVMWLMDWHDSAFPKASVGAFFPYMISTLCGYIAGFLIYPLTDDYILSLVSVAAFIRACTILISIVALFYLFHKFSYSVRYASMGTLFFLVAAFLIFKTKAGSEYLYWQYNYCTVYLYGVPSYLASAFSIYLIVRHVYDPKFGLNMKTGFLLAALYFLSFSFLPAGFLVSAVSLCIIIVTFINCRNVIQVLKQCWLNFVALFLFAVSFFCECRRTFGTGYFQVPTDFVGQLVNSFKFFLVIFTRMNKLFLVPVVIIIVWAVGTFLLAKYKHTQTEEDARFSKISVILWGSLLFTAVFYILFGAMDFGHVEVNGFIRTDTMYVFYFLMIAIAAFCLTYILRNYKSVVSAFAVVILVMSYSVVSPRNHYSSTVGDIDQTQHISNQMIEIMRAVVQEVSERDQQGITYTIVHVPYGGYGGAWCDYPLYYHNVTNHFCTVEFRYEPGIDGLYFE